MHVIKLIIKVVKTLILTVKLISYTKYKNVKMFKKMLKYQGEWAFISSYDGLGGLPILRSDVITGILYLCIKTICLVMHRLHVSA
jgi:hypothetical protein